MIGVMAPHPAVVHVSSAQTLTEHIDEGLSVCRDEFARLDTRVVSATPANLEATAELLGTPTVHGVVTLVDPARLVTAQWFAAIRSQRTWTLSAYADAAVGSAEPNAAEMQEQLWWGLEPHSLTTRAIEVFGAENVTVVTTPHSDSTELWRRFCRACGVEEPPRAGRRSKGHPLDPTTVGVAPAELIRRLNELGPVREMGAQSYAASVTTVVAQDALNTRAQRVVALPPDYERWAAAQADALIGVVAASGVEVIGELDDLRPSPRADSDGSTPTTTELLSASIDGLAELVVAHATLSESDMGSQSLSRPGLRRKVRIRARRLASVLRHRIRRR